MIVDHPNIVFITIDAWRYDALGLAPDKRWLRHYNLETALHTPNLDHFVDNSTYFTQALATAPHTTVSHASIMTGLFPPQHGVRSFMYERLPDDTVTLAQLLRRQNYTTVTLREGEDVSQPGILQKVDVLRGFDNVVHDLQGFVRIAQCAQKKGESVFAFLHLWDLHAPYLYANWARETGALEATWSRLETIADQWQVRLPRKDQLAEQHMMDFQHRVAEKIADVEERIAFLFHWYVAGLNWFDQVRWPVVERTLQEAGLWDETVIFVFGDHGEGVHPDGEGKTVFAHGTSLLDDVLRVPLLVRGLPPGRGKTVDGQVSLVDLAPTVLDLLGISERPLWEAAGAQPHGESLLPLLADSSSTAPRLHFAELCRGDLNSWSEPLPQYLYQRCVRGHGYKVLGHYQPLLMERYMSRYDTIDRLRQRLLRKMGRQPFPEHLQDYSPCHRYFWSDIRADPEERNPQHWTRHVPPTPAELQVALETLYEGARRGPTITVDGFAESALLKRLSALGYVD